MGKVTLPHRIGGFMKQSADIRIGENTYNDIIVLSVDRLEGGKANFYYENFPKTHNTINSSIILTSAKTQIAEKSNNNTITSSITLKEE